MLAGKYARLFFVLVASIVVCWTGTLCGDGSWLIDHAAEARRLVRFSHQTDFEQYQVINPPKAISRFSVFAIDRQQNVWLQSETSENGYSSPTVFPIIELIRSSGYKKVRRFARGYQCHLTADATGRIWAATSSHVFTLYRVDSSLKFQAFSIADPKNDPGALSQNDMAVEPSGNVWFGGEVGDGVHLPPPGHFTEFLEAARYAESVALSARIRPYHFTVDSAGNLWVSGQPLDATDYNVYELLKSSGYKNHRGFTSGKWPPPLTVDKSDNIWFLTAPETVGAPENQLIELSKSSGHLKPSTTKLSTAPFGVAVDSNHNIWVTSPYSVLSGTSPIPPLPRDNILRIDAAGKVSAFTVPGWPYGIAVNRAGNIWIATGLANSNNLLELSGTRPGKPVRTLNVSGRVFGVTVDAADNLWVTNASSNHANVIELFGGSGYRKSKQFSVPGRTCGITVDAADNVWAASFDADSDNVTELLKSAGYYRSRTFTVLGEPFGVTVDNSSNVWVTVTSRSANRIVELLRSWNYAKQKSFSIGLRPYGIAADGDGNVWVAGTSYLAQEVTELTKSSHYTHSRKFAVNVGFVQVAVDTTGDLWLQDLDYIEVRGLTEGPECVFPWVCAR